MGSLENKQIKDSYKDLLQISNSNAGIDSTGRGIEDGEGTLSPLGLSTTTIYISGHILPTDNAQYDLGNAENKIRHLFLSDNTMFIGDTYIKAEGDAVRTNTLQADAIKLKNEIPNQIDGTTGDWTITQGDTNFYLINNLTGQRFRVMLEEV